MLNILCPYKVQMIEFVMRNTEFPDGIGQCQVNFFYILEEKIDSPLNNYTTMSKVLIKFIHAFGCESQSLTA